MYTWTSSRTAAGLALACALVGCGGSGNSTGSGGNGGNGGSAQTGSSSMATGGGGSTGTGNTYCVVGMKGCACEGGLCASGLVCKNDTCCDKVTGDCSQPPNPTGSGGSGGAGAGTGGGSVCMPGVVGPVITDCGYPYSSSNPLTNVAFSETEVLRAIDPSGGAPLASVRLFYNDEHALTLGVRHVDVVTAGGTMGKDYPVSPLTMDPDQAYFPLTGTNLVSGDHSGLDQSGRPMWPVLYVTDITNDPNSRAGDWQEGGTPYNPTVVWGSWKAALRTVDKTMTPPVISITPDADPAKNDWNLGGGDPVPPELTTNQGYGAEVRWDLVLVAGRSYRIQVLVHDGDQNKGGGDSGEACVDFCAGAACPEGANTCMGDGDCSGRVCVNGCCVVAPPR
jgi:hypothetical protein